MENTGCKAWCGQRQLDGSVPFGGEGQGVFVGANVPHRQAWCSTLCRDERRRPMGERVYVQMRGRRAACSCKPGGSCPHYGASPSVYDDVIPQQLPPKSLDINAVSEALMRPFLGREQLNVQLRTDKRYAATWAGLFNAPLTGLDPGGYSPGLAPFLDDLKRKGAIQEKQLAEIKRVRNHQLAEDGDSAVARAPGPVRDTFADLCNEWDLLPDAGR